MVTLLSHVSDLTQLRTSDENVLFGCFSLVILATLPSMPWSQIFCYYVTSDHLCNKALGGRGSKPSRLIECSWKGEARDCQAPLWQRCLTAEPCLTGATFTRLLLRLHGVESCLVPSVMWTLARWTGQKPISHLSSSLTQSC